MPLISILSINTTTDSVSHTQVLTTSIICSSSDYNKVKVQSRQTMGNKHTWTMNKISQKLFKKCKRKGKCSAMGMTAEPTTPGSGERWGRVLGHYS